MKKFWKQLIITASAIAFLVIAWLVAYAVVGNEWLVPAFSDCVKKTWVILTTGSFYKAFFATLLRVLTAFVFSFVLALVFALVAYTVPMFGAFFAPMASMLRSLPTLAILLILLVWTDAGRAPVIVAVLSLFPMLYAGFTASFAGVDRELIEMSRVYKVGFARRAFQLYLPSVAPYMARESAAALSFALKLVVSAEVLARTYGSVGGWMQDAKAFSEIDRERHFTNRPAERGRPRRGRSDKRKTEGLL